MKHLFLTYCFLTITFSLGQTKDHLQFDYDNAGNQIRRFLIDVTPGRQANPDIKNPESLTEEDLIKADIYDDIKYYPNPVEEELFVQWKLVNENYVDRVAIYSMAGQLMKSYSNLKNETTTTLAFHNCPQGFYNVILFYANGEQKSLKIVKR